MKLTERQFTQGTNCLKYFDYKGFAVVVDENTTGVQTVDNKKVLLAGTPFPADDNTCKGYILHDYDVTKGSQSATVVYEGAIDNAVLTKNNITVSSAAKTATPRVTFFD